MISFEIKVIFDDSQKNILIMSSMFSAIILGESSNGYHFAFYLLEKKSKNVFYYGYLKVFSINYQWTLRMMVNWRITLSILKGSFWWLLFEISSCWFTKNISNNCQLHVLYFKKKYVCTCLSWRFSWSVLEGPFKWWLFGSSPSQISKDLALIVILKGVTDNSREILSINCKLYCFLSCTHTHKKKL